MDYTLDRLLAANSALVVIDMQNDFVHENGAFAKGGYDVVVYQQLVPVIQYVRGLASKSGVPIWLVGMSHNDQNDGSDAWITRRKAKNHPNSCRTGTWGADFYKGLEPQKEDHVLRKHRYSAFVGTSLHEQLRERKIETLVFVGINTNTCVESTARDAHMLGYHVIVLSDATACAYPDAYEPSLLNIERHFGLVENSQRLAEIWGA